MKDVLKIVLSVGLLIVIFFCCCLGSCFSIFVLTSGSDNISIKTSNFKEHLLQGDLLSTTKIAIVNVSGEITYSIPGDTAPQKGATSDNIIEQLDIALNDPLVKTVVLRMNTPGGAVDAATPICSKIDEVRKKKDVYTFVDSMGASLGYLIANCTDYIYTRPTSITGSIGVILQAVDFYGVLENFGGKVAFITNSDGAQKGGGDIFDPNSDTYKTYQKILDESFDFFLSHIEQGRAGKLTLSEIKSLADGRIYSGKQAVDNKLADEALEFDDMIASVAEKQSISDYSVVDYLEESNPFGSLLSNLPLGKADLESALKKDEVKLLMILK